MVFHGLRFRPTPHDLGQIVVFTSATAPAPSRASRLLINTRRCQRPHPCRRSRTRSRRRHRNVNVIGTDYIDFSGFVRASGADKSPKQRAKIEVRVSVSSSPTQADGRPNATGHRPRSSVCRAGPADANLTRHDGRAFRAVAEQVVQPQRAVTPGVDSA